MTSACIATEASIAKFQNLLRELFQFDCADLDFGIYRIMNHKRDAIERFINEKLPAAVAAELDNGPLAQQTRADANLSEVAQRIRSALGDNAIDGDGRLVQAHHQLPIGKEYLEAHRQAAAGTRNRDAVEAEIYNHLYSFFSRYYEEGDFISKRRYSRNQRYVIPYNGEEVYLHWANSDQYYVKTDEYFRNYNWNAPNGVSVHFRLENADVEQNNIKGDRRFFIHRISETEWDTGNNAIIIPFEYRPLSGSEGTKYGKTNTQDKIIEAAVSDIPEQLGAFPAAIVALNGEQHHYGNGEVSRLEHHLRAYVRRNNSDFFIHKDLSGFLSRELDFYLKNEVLNLDNLVSTGQDMAEGSFQQMRLTKALGSQIIDFLAQIEGFQKMLSLLPWLHRQLGYEKTTDLLVDTKRTDEGFDPDGRSHIHARLASQARQLQGVTTDDLQRYDDNIHRHLTAMNAGRPEPITLRYFQYLAALYTEIYLDRYCNKPEGLLRSLNEFVAQHNANRVANERYESFAAADLDKLAFWMATGSGKTLLLHLHYRQFLQYNRTPLDNILLVTPNERLSQQHIEELLASNIPAARFDLDEHGSLFTATGTVRVTEITKLVTEKQGEGDSIPVDALEGNNLIFVDEAHKGSGGEAWRAVRNALGETGFTFEYSATFGQALAAANNEALLTEYGKAIAFDYSYRHFYNDGYGKDFQILNLQQEAAAGQTDTLLLANLLSFYEQQLVFAEQETVLRPYNLSRPLWVFIGRNVNAVYQESGKPHSDVLTVARFLHRVLRDRVWATAAISRLLNGESGLTYAESGQDIFADKFDYLRRHGTDAAAVYQDALARVMHANGGGLQLCDLRGSEGELGLKAYGSTNYFGVIYIGDTPAFKSLVEADDAGIVVTDDALSGSLFERINEPGSTVEVLAGSRRFIEGWNSWRVSNMGLLNIGQSEGTQIIQLFGRGVRLRGRDMSLKRSSAFVGESHPDYIRLLETLNIFALRANYMTQFRDYLESEGINTQMPVELPLFIRPNQDFLNKGLVIPRLDGGRDFASEETVLLKHDAQIRPVSVVMSSTVQQVNSGQGGVTDTSAISGIERQIPQKALDLVDWNKTYLALLEHKETKGFSNLLIRPESLRSILETNPTAYRLEAEEAVVEPKNDDDWRRLQEAVTNILRRYADALYRRRQARWESNTLTYRQLDDSDANFRFNIGENGNAGRYIVKVPQGNTDLTRQIEQLIADCNALYREDQGALPRIYFDQHLYQPLLVETSGITSSPPGLQESERKFVTDLRDYCAIGSGGLTTDAEVFLLRNLTRGKGVGFFETSGFYPDFMLWVKSNDQQRIVFVEPHGMLNERAYIHDEKAMLHERLPELAREIASRSGNPNVQLDSFIVSATSYQDLREYYDNGEWTKDDFAAKHILFREHDGDHAYLAQILQC